MVSPSMLGVDGGDILQGVDDGLGEEAHEAELHAVLLHEVVLVFRAQGHDGGHVDLVEGREHGGLVLGGDQALAMVWRSLVIFTAGLPFAGRRRQGAWAAGARLRVANGAGRSAWQRPASPQPAWTSPLVTRPPLPEPEMDAGSMPVSAGEATDGGRLRRRIFDFRFLIFDWPAAGGEAAGAADSSIVATTWPIFTSVPAATLKVILAGDLGGAFGGDLVGLELEEGLVFLDDGAVGHVPLGEHAGGDGFAHRGDFDFNGHGRRGSESESERLRIVLVILGVGV
jgi:hypothetical protein